MRDIMRLIRSEEQRYHAHQPIVNKNAKSFKSQKCVWFNIIKAAIEDSYYT